MNDRADRSRRAEQNLPPSPYDRPEDVIFEPLGAFTQQGEPDSGDQDPNPAFRRPGPVPAGPATPEGDGRMQPSWIDLAHPGPPIVFEQFPGSDSAHGAESDDADIGPFRPASRFDQPARPGQGDAEPQGGALGFEPVPFDDPNLGSAWRTQERLDTEDLDAPIESDFFEDRRLPVPALPPASTGARSNDRRRSRFSLPLRLALPILVITLGAAALVLFARSTINTAQGEVVQLESVHRIELDNSAAEGTLLRTRRALERTVGTGSVSPATARDTLPYLEKRQLEVDAYEDLLARTELPQALKQNLTAAYADDHSYIEDSINILKKAVDSPEEANADLTPNVEEFYDIVESHRDLATSLDAQRDDLSAELAQARNRSQLPLILGIAGLGLLGLIGALLAIRAVNRPLKRITRTVNLISDGDLEARSEVAGRDQVGRLGFAVDTMSVSLTEAVGQLEDDARRGSQNRVVFEALDIADSESEVHRVAEQALGLFAPQIPGELLLSEQSGGRLWRVASSPTAGAPGCTIESPAGCFALRRGQTVIFESADSINSCPKLRNRPGGSCSAVCVPVSFSGQALGVLHTTAPDHQPPDQATVDQLVDLGTQLGARIGTLRTLESTRLQAATDGLTGLPNRRMIESRVAEFLGDRIPFVLVLADLDRFKSINDRFGHEVGDRALQLFSRTLQDNVRDADVIARFGGEEFVIVYPEMTVGGSMEAIERLRIALTTAQANSSVPGFTCSFGVTHSSVGASFDEIFRIADAGLLVAKEMGRNRSIYADRELADRVFGTGGNRDSGRALPPGLRPGEADPADRDDEVWSMENLQSVPFGSDSHDATVVDPDRTPRPQV